MKKSNFSPHPGDHFAKKHSGDMTPMLLHDAAVGHDSNLDLGTAGH